ncbi:hypothetical protein BDV97DRAFT_350730 [Delphinella strobiligena]|nr:hypothetical protein BDV97DRAFT_350730 [Delphinella strobiligena]
MAFLSSLLNPEPTVDDSVLSLTQGDGDQSRAKPGTQDASYQKTRDGVCVLNTSPASNVPSSASWTGHSAVHHSPSAAQPDITSTSFTQDDRRPSFTQDNSGASFTRRLSAYSDNNAPIELPQPPQVARKMSSPTLHHYHVPSHSPEQHRRPSYLPTSNDALTLPPIKSVPASSSSAPPASSHALVGQDDSVMVKDDSEKPHSHIAKIDATNKIQFIADHRQPDYVRDEPTTSQIRQPSPPDLESASQPHMAHSLPPLDTSNPANDTSLLTPNPDPPFINLKQEHSAHAHSPLRESSVPVPSTEMPAPTTNLNVPKKPPPSKSAGKKGTASSVKKEPPTKKRKTDSLAAAAKRSGTPSSSQKPKNAAKRLASASATPANSSRTASSPPRSVASPDPDHDADALHSDDEEEDEEQGTPDPDAELYCLCRRPDTGTFMIGCDGGCDDWFHGKCVNIAERDKGLIDRYVCPRCSEKGLGPTTWKRMCRRVACRNPARTPSSKYCSDACGVLFFKELLATRTRVVGPDDQGARGGVLSAGEVRFLVDSVSSVEEFKRLGEPPATLNPSRDDESGQESSLTKAEHERLTEIPHQKDLARNRHMLLKDRIKFITVVQQRATTLAEARGLKPKDFCGFDPRIIWTDEEFANWRVTPEAAELLQSGVVNRATAQGSRTDTDGDTAMANGDEGGALDLCTKKRCARHNDWAKLAIDDTRFEMSENGEVMRGLDREGKEIVQRAGLRARVLKARGVEWEVEYHDHEDKDDKDDVSLADATPTESNERQDQEEEPKEEQEQNVASSEEVQQPSIDATDMVDVAT